MSNVQCACSNIEFLELYYTKYYILPPYIKQNILFPGHNQFWNEWSKRLLWYTSGNNLGIKLDILGSSSIFFSTLHLSN